MPEKMRNLIHDFLILAITAVAILTDFETNNSEYVGIN